MLLLTLFFSIGIIRHKNRTYIVTGVGLGRKHRENKIHARIDGFRHTYNVKIDLVRIVTFKEYAQGRIYPSFSREILVPKIGRRLGRRYR